MEQLLLKSIVRNNIENYLQDFAITLPYVNESLQLKIFCDDNKVFVNDFVVQEAAEITQIELFFSEFHTSFLLQLNKKDIHSFITDENTGLFAISSSSNIPVQFLCLYKQFFLSFPLKKSSPSKNCVETLEDESWCPASYNRTDADFEHFGANFGRRDLQYPPAKLREVEGLWLLEPETVKNPFEVALIPVEFTTIKYAFQYFSFIFAVFEGSTIIFTRESGLFSMCCEFPFEFKQNKEGKIGFAGFEVEFSASFDVVKLQDRKIVKGDVYPFYDVSIIGQKISCGDIFDNKAYLAYNNEFKIFEISASEIIGLKAPEIAGFTGEEEQVLINDQNTHQPAKVVDLEDMQDGYDINNETDLFRSDFSQPYAESFKSQLIETVELNFVVLFKLCHDIFLGVRGAEIVIFRPSTSTKFTVSDDVLNWQIQNQQLQIFTNNSIISPFFALNFNFFAFNHGINTVNVNQNFCYKNQPLFYYPNADYGTVQQIARIDSILEENDLLFIIISSVLSIFRSGKLIFTQFVENNMKLISFSNYELKLFSTLNHYTETRKISVLFYDFLNSLLLCNDFEQFINLIPFSRFSITSFKHENMIDNVLKLSNSQINELTELAVLPPAEPFQFYDADYEIQFWTLVLERKFKIDLNSQNLKTAPENELLAYNLTALIAISFSFKHWPENNFAREICLKCALFKYMKNEKFDVLMGRFFDAEEVENQYEIVNSGSVIAGNVDVFALRGGCSFNEAVARQQISFLFPLPFSAENARLAVLAHQENASYDRLLLHWFITQNDLKHEISDAFPDFCVSKFVQNLQEYQQVCRPKFELKSVVSDCEKYCFEKERKVVDWDKEEDKQYQRFQRKIAEWEEAKAEFSAKLASWEAEHFEDLLIGEYKVAVNLEEKHLQ
ncbi:hypothetical protein SS50377_26582 [Spironucleus salmonicida]|uniref:Uncharacterized protein n=1 Tax=Spironucleus salmonicida TaxID=348837 RepID=V6LAF3_9EUKA|nr:hypothetical protein SS50377_26582 [Spironucleus salmonicida]|eukprot:EST41435.1 Hypothetical protein SS50377_19152 [Spironucleus salmonicida]